MLCLALAAVSSSFPTGMPPPRPRLDDRSTGTMPQVMLRDLDTSPETPETPESDLRKPIYISAASASMIFLLLAQRSIHQRGYLLSRSWWVATDSVMWIWMGLAGGVWTLLVFLSAWHIDDTNPCKLDIKSPACSARLAFTPWILDGVFLWWLIRVVLLQVCQVVSRTETPKPPSLSPFLLPPKCHAK